MNHIPTSMYYPGDSVIHQMQPLSKLICFILMVVAVILSGTVPEYIIMGAFTVFLIWLTKLPPKMALGSVRRLVIFFIVIVAMNFCFYGQDDALIQFGFFKPSLSGLSQGITIVIRVVILLIMGNILVLTTAPLALTMSLEYLFAPLRIFKVPVDQIAMILSVAIQFIPTLFEETDQIRTAQTARGARFDSKRIRDKAYAVLPLVIPIFLSAFKRADELSTAMEARGYRVNHRRKRKKKIEMKTRDIISLVVCGGLCALMIVLR